MYNVHTSATLDARPWCAHAQTAAVADRWRSPRPSGRTKYTVQTQQRNDSSGPVSHVYNARLAGGRRRAGACLSVRRGGGAAAGARAGGRVRTGRVSGRGRRGGGAASARARRTRERAYKTEHPGAPCRRPVARPRSAKRHTEGEEGRRVRDSGAPPSASSPHRTEQ